MPGDERVVLLVAEAGADYRADPPDPIAAWIDLMEAVEALGGMTPPRPPRRLVDARL